MSWQQYRRKGALAELRPYVKGEVTKDISMPADYTPEPGDMIARNPKDPSDMWLVMREHFDRFWEMANGND